MDHFAAVSEAPIASYAGADAFETLVPIEEALSDVGEEEALAAESDEARAPLVRQPGVRAGVRSAEVLSAEERARLEREADAILARLGERRVPLARERPISSEMRARVRNGAITHYITLERLGADELQRAGFAPAALVYGWRGAAPHSESGGVEHALIGGAVLEPIPEEDETDVDNVPEQPLIGAESVARTVTLNEARHSAAAAALIGYGVGARGERARVVATQDGALALVVQI